MIRFVVYLLLLAAVLYGVFWALDRRDGGRRSTPTPPPPRGPVGPDDDEMFLRDLERRRRAPGDRPEHPGEQ